MFNKYPREIGLPRKVVTNIDEYLKFINKVNGIKSAVHTSLYSFKTILENNKPDYNSAIVDKLFFDFDDKTCNAYEECNKLHQELKKEKIKHVIVMSGRGYHLYIFCLPLSPNNIKSCIYNAQHHFIDKLKLHVDLQVIGNPAQLVRIPNTYNQRGKRFCIPLTNEQFEIGDSTIKKMAEHQNLISYISIGNELFDISKFDYKTNEIKDLNLKLDLKFEDSSNQDYMNNCDIFIKELLLKKNLGWKERYLVILYFKEKGFLIDEVKIILKENLTENKYIHCVLEERQLQYLFSRNDLVFPNGYGVNLYK